MPEWLTKLLSSLKFPFLQRYFWSILLFLAVLGWLLLLLPLELFRVLQFSDLRQTYGEIIGMTTFISSIGFCFGMIYKGFKYVQSNLANKKKVQEQQKSLRILTPVEYTYLHRFIESNTQTYTFTLYDGVVAGLIEKGIIYKPSSQANKGGEQDFNIFPWAYEYLQKHPDVIRQGEQNVNQQ